MDLLILQKVRMTFIESLEERVSGKSRGIDGSSNNFIFDSALVRASEDLEGSLVSPVGVPRVVD